MERRKLTKEDLDKVRHIEGFPIGKDEDIIALSDAPYYTACPNPFIEDFIRENGTPYNEATDDYHREPFAADVSEGKSDPLYSVHTYHTKVPYKAIMNYVFHYTKPGDVILDGFCGTGMTGVAARSGELASELDRLAYQKELGDIELGARKAVLVDLSPAATHIANRYNMGFDLPKLQKEGKELLALLKKECGWMYSTRHEGKEHQYRIDSGNETGQINYTVWSDVMICPSCGDEYVFWDLAVDRAKKEVYDNYMCPHCHAEIKKKDRKCAFEVVLDGETDKTHTIPKQVPVLISYTSSTGKRYEKAPDANDIETIERINQIRIPYSYPTDDLPNGYNTRQPISKGIKSVDAFFTKRNLYGLSLLWNHASEQMKFALTAFILRASKMNKVHIHNFLFGGGGWNAGYLTGVLYFPSLAVETSIIELLTDRLESLERAFSNYRCERENAVISTQSSTDLSNIPNNSIDYIFTNEAVICGLTPEKACNFKEFAA